MTKICAGILAHVDAGKTTISEALLYKASAIKTMGRVDLKNTYLDTDYMEKERGITIYSKSARLNLGDFEMILIDTPGHVDFSAEMERTLAVLDIAVLLVSASDKVQAHTKTVWKLLKRYGIPTIIFVNKMDLPDTNKADILKTLKEELSQDIEDFTDDLSDEFFENAATVSEDFLEDVLKNGYIPKEKLKAAFEERLLFPCLFGSALKNEGVDRLFEVIKDYCPKKAYPDEFGAITYKITRENNVRLSHIKLTGGSLVVKSMLNDEKVNEIRLYSGDKYETVKEAFAGDIVTIPGLIDTKPGTVFGKGRFSRLISLEPVLNYTVFYKGDTDTHGMLKILYELEEEEPGLNVEYDERLKEIHVCLMGEVQTEILTRKIKDLYNVDVSFGQGRISYRETVSDTVEGVGHFEPLRHYAEVHLKLEPLERGSGLMFESEADLDELSLNWQRLVLTHLKEREHKGVLTGSPITDMKITLVSGKAHIKHTEGGDFRQATYRAVRNGLMKAQSVLLEPFYDFTLEIPDNTVGRAMTDLAGMSATVSVSESANGISVLNGSGPVSTLNGYAKNVSAYTGGKGHMSLVVSGFKECHNAEEVIEKIAYDPEADIRNTADSVFCSHGAGVVVPWNEVENYMHLPYTVNVEKPDDASFAEPINHGTYKEKEIFVSTEEIDAIIGKTAHANQKKTQTSYKGISASLREKNWIGGRREEKEPVYKGTAVKEKFLLIDGYNVVHAWDELKELARIDLSAAAGRLIDIVSNYQAVTGYNTIIVFDAYKVTGHPREEMMYHNIKVVYTKTAETADRYIERYAHENGKKFDVTVVTSDGAEQVIIRGGGCALLSSKDFYEEVEKVQKRLREHKNLWQEE